MQSRRSFIGALMALPFVGAVVRRARGMPAPTPVSVTIEAIWDEKGAREKAAQFRAECDKILKDLRALVKQTDDLHATCFDHPMQA